MLVDDRCAKWVTEQVGKGRAVSDVAKELACDWHTVNDAVSTYGEALQTAARKRLNATTAIGLDETSLSNTATTSRSRMRRRSRMWPTIRSSKSSPPELYRCRRVGQGPTPGMEGPHRIRGTRHVGHLRSGVHGGAARARQVVDAFHCVQLANRALDQIRRRVQQQQTGHRGRRDDPLYRIRRVLLTGEEKLDEAASQRLTTLLELGDPAGEVALAYRVKERHGSSTAARTSWPPARCWPISSTTAPSQPCLPSSAEWRGYTKEMVREDRELSLR